MSESLAAQEAYHAAWLAAMDLADAQGALIVPSEEELAGALPGPDGPPEDDGGWPVDIACLMRDGGDPLPEPAPDLAGADSGSLGHGYAFSAGGAADTLRGGSVLAKSADDAWQAGLSSLDDDQLIGVLTAARRVASWATALEAAAVSDLLARREARAAAVRDRRPVEHAVDEIAAAVPGSRSSPVAKAASNPEA